MPSGERSQTWYPELVELLRMSWRGDASWAEVVCLRDQLQRSFDALRAARNIQPPMFYCPRCGTRRRMGHPRITVRAMLLALRRFGIVSADIVRQQERAWARHRAQHGLDLLGHPSPAATTANEHDHD
jgi:hypothetical protein